MTTTWQPRRDDPVSTAEAAFNSVMLARFYVRWWTRVSQTASPHDRFATDLCTYTRERALAFWYRARWAVQCDRRRS